MILVLAAALAATPPKPTAVATLEARSGSTVTGTVSFFADPGAPIHVVITVRGAAPGKHAVHIHEKGDCSAADASSAGSHFNPEKKAHGDHGSPEHHPGDFGNIEVGPDGTGHLELDSSSFTIAPGPLSARGLAVIVHEKPDDFGQPTGNAGGRQACGIIQ